MLEKILEIYDVQELLKADGFDEAVIGIEEHKMRLIYSVKKTLDILKKEMTEQEAVDYFLHNIHCAYVGEKTPIWCWDCF